MQQGWVVARACVQGWRFAGLPHMCVYGVGVGERRTLHLIWSIPKKGITFPPSLPSLSNPLCTRALSLGALPAAHVSSEWACAWWGGRGGEGFLIVVRFHSVV